jgi:hypothetical protein
LLFDVEGSDDEIRSDNGKLGNVTLITGEETKPIDLSSEVRTMR